LERDARPVSDLGIHAPVPDPLAQILNIYGKYVHTVIYTPMMPQCKGKYRLQFGPKYAMLGILYQGATNENPSSLYATQ